MLLTIAPSAGPPSEGARKLVFANRYSVQWSIVSGVPGGELGLFLGSSLRPRFDRHNRPWKTALGYEFAVSVGGADRGTAFFSWGGNYGLVYHRHHVAALGYGGPGDRLFYQFGGGVMLWRSTLVALEAEVRLGVVLGARRQERVKGIVGGEARIVGILGGVPLPHFGVFAGLLLF
ncbi:hypothetical protein [Nannocystis bainbridge]|uniref:hypothetical protein n=1 Tax=Nannocystis bainbridge TaxID=2995303 RepID=UPI00232F454E|nr:hypothetical protein [Nannocystis bainbridge]